DFFLKILIIQLCFTSLKRAKNTQEPVPIVWCPLRCVCAKHSSRLVDQGTRQSNRYFPVSASCENLRELCIGSDKFFAINPRARNSP
uniref:Secreted protein n=1 Tax=Scophthalmus maximus TaxID=52904 RepID=A0A8D2ZXY6_SCOMX